MFRFCFYHINKHILFSFLNTFCGNCIAIHLKLLHIIIQPSYMIAKVRWTFSTSSILEISFFHLLFLLVQDAHFNAMKSNIVRLWREKKKCISWNDHDENPWINSSGSSSENKNEILFLSFSFFTGQTDVITIDRLLCSSIATVFVSIISYGCV